MSAVALSMLLFTGCEKEEEVNMDNSKGSTNTTNPKSNSIQAKSSHPLYNVINSMNQQESILVEGPEDDFTYQNVPFPNPGGEPSGSYVYPYPDGVMDAFLEAIDLLRAGCDVQIDIGYGLIAVNAVSC